MQNQYQYSIDQKPAQLHFGHLGLIAMTGILLLGVSYMKNPAMFSSHPATLAVDPSLVPHYYAYVTPAEDRQPLVAGASTAGPGVSIINEDGSVTPVDTGSVLGASTQDVVVPMDNIPVNQVPDSDASIKQYFSDATNVEASFINNADFQTALTSGDQKQIDAQAVNFTTIVANLEKLPVPASLVKLQKLKIAQYQAGIGLLHNFTQADNNPTLVGQYLDQFLKAQDDMDNETLAAEQKFGLDLGIVAPAPATAGNGISSGQSAAALSDTGQSSGDLSGSDPSAISDPTQSTDPNDQ